VYETFVRPLLFQLDPERVHHLTLDCLRLVSMVLPPPLTAQRNARVSTELFGIKFPNRVGLAAGFDKNGVALPAWAALGFGFVEVGTVTARPQPGNPKPRLFRIAEAEALVNRLGFNNEGAEAIGRRLANLRKRYSLNIPIGINIGKNRDTPLEEAAENYLAAFRQLASVGDYFVLNVSSPNTPDLRQLQTGSKLRELISAVQAENSRKPMLIKIAPDLTLPDLDHLIELAETSTIAGLVATNTTVNQDLLPPQKRTSGGLSGAPLRRRALEILRQIRQRTALPVIAVGGIMNLDDARERFDEGADLVQVYTGLIYRGPNLVKGIGRLTGPVR
jgi:dihydroorotate dehydrogenase